MSTYTFQGNTSIHSITPLFTGKTLTEGHRKISILANSFDPSGMLSFSDCYPVAPPTSCKLRSSVQGQLPLSVSLLISWSPGETFFGAYFSAVPSFKYDWQALPLITQAGMKTSFCFCTMSLADKPNTYVDIPHRSSLENLSHVHGLRPQYVLYPFKNLKSLWITGKGLHMNCKLWFQI